MKRSLRRVRPAALAAALGLCASLACAQAIPVGKRDRGLLISDLAEDRIFLCRDLNGDGDATDQTGAPPETIEFAGPGNASGLAVPCGAVLALFESNDGSVYWANLDDKCVYRGIDADGDGSVNGPNEINKVFNSFTNFSFQFLSTPNGIAQDLLARVYVADTPSTTSGNGKILRMDDRDSDGLFESGGEATLWWDMSNIGSTRQIKPFDLVFIGDVAYVADVNAIPNAVYRAHDADGDGSIGPGEWSVYYQDGAFGGRCDQALATDGASLYVNHRQGGSTSEAEVYRLTDLDGSGTINANDEVVEVWNKAFLPAGRTLSNGVALGCASDGRLAILSSGNGTSANAFLMTDGDFDGLYKTVGETSAFATDAYLGLFLRSGRALQVAGRPCRLDFNLDGVLNPDDLGDFITGYFDEPPDLRAAWNRQRDGDGNLFVNPDDLGDYITQYFGDPCP